MGNSFQLVLGAMIGRDGNSHPKPHKRRLSIVKQEGGGCYFVMIKHELDAQCSVELFTLSVRLKCLPKLSPSPLSPCYSTWILGRARSQDGLAKLLRTHPCLLPTAFDCAVSFPAKPVSLPM